MKSLEAIKMSKLGKKKVPSAMTGQIGPDIPTAKTGQIGGDIPTAKTLSSADILKAHKVGSNKVPTANIPKFKQEPEYEAEVELGPTEVQGYSPIKNYLKKKGK